MKLLFIIIICMNICFSSCFISEEFISKFKQIDLPLYLDTEDFDVYNLFDSMAIMECPDLEILHESCNGKSTYKYGFILFRSEKFYLLMYCQNVSEDSVFYKLATLNSKNEIISSLNIMGYCGDSPSINGRILNNLEIYTINREILNGKPDADNKIEVKEIENKYIIEANGEIKHVYETAPYIKYFKIGSQSEFIPTN